MKPHNDMATAIRALVTDYGYDAQSMPLDSDPGTWPVTDTRAWFRSLDAPAQRELLSAAWRTTFTPMAEAAYAWQRSRIPPGFDDEVRAFYGRVMSPEEADRLKELAAQVPRACQYMTEVATDADRLAVYNFLFALFDSDDDLALRFLRDDMKEAMHPVVLFTGHECQLTRSLLAKVRVVEDKEKQS